MSVDTSIRGHWVLDREHSNKLDLFDESENVFDSLDTLIKKNKNIFEWRKNEEYVSIDANIEPLDLSYLPKLRYTRARHYHKYVSKSQKWVGHVTKVDAGGFYAQLVDPINKGTDEVAYFENDEVPLSDKKLLDKGSIFYWSVGYNHDENGQITKKSLIRFKRSYPLTVDEIDSIADRADHLDKNIDWE